MRHRYDPTSIFGFDHVNVYEEFNRKYEFPEGW